MKYIRKGDTSSSDKSDKNRLKQLTDQNMKYKRRIKALKKVTFEENPQETSSSKKEEDIDAGDQFGGKSSKRAKK